MTDEELLRALAITRTAVVEAGNELKKYYGNIETLTNGDGAIFPH